MKKSWAVCLFLVVGASVIGAERVFGPEWEKETFPHTDAVMYRMTLSVPVEHPSPGDTSFLKVPLKQVTLEIGDHDEQRGYYVRAEKDFEVFVERDLKGKLYHKSFKIGKWIYADIDGDDEIDGRTDTEEQQPWILLGDRFIPVQNTKMGLLHPEQRSMDFKTRYILSRGKWQVK